MPGLWEAPDESGFAIHGASRQERPPRASNPCKLKIGFSICTDAALDKVRVDWREMKVHRGAGRGRAPVPALPGHYVSAYGVLGRGIPPRSTCNRLGDWKLKPTPWLWDKQAAVSNRELYDFVLFVNR
jgi:hypothetical protein